MNIQVKIILGLAVFLGVFGKVAGAHPPSDIELVYVFEQQVLRIEMRHTTHDPREDFIRKVIITKNQDEPVVKYYNIQANTLRFSDDIPLSVNEGDVILIDAYSKEGGHSRGQIVVKQESGDEKEKDEGEIKQGDSGKRKKY